MSASIQTKWSADILVRIGWMTRKRLADRNARAPLVLIALLATFLPVFAAPAFPFTTNDVIAFVGGADVSTAQKTAHLESLLTCALPGAHFRNFGWEGDTVYAQPRDFNFPPLSEHLRKAGATVIVLQFGRAEALSTNAGFRAAYETLIQQFQAITPRLVLVAPPPFENPGGLLPDLSQKNRQLADDRKIIHEVAQTHHLTFVDLFTPFTSRWGEAPAEPTHGRSGALLLTEDGLQLTPLGQALCAIEFARQLGLANCLTAAGSPTPNGAWTNPRFESLRQAIIQKNRLWFNYWRPQNWAFLGGDRTEQPSSRDYRDPKIRWFPKEMEEFRPLIETQEHTILQQADAIHQGLTQSSQRHKEEQK